MKASEFDGRRHNGAHNREKEECPQGHPLWGDNLLPADLARGRRGCRLCHNAQARRYGKARTKKARDAT